MPRNSFVSFLIVQEINKIKKGYCANCQYMKNNKCELKRNIKQCLKENKKIVGGNENES